MCKQNERCRQLGLRSLFLPSVLIVLAAAIFLRVANSNPAVADESPFYASEDDIPERVKAFRRELEKSADEISGRELNEAHLAMLGGMLLPSDSKLQLHLHYGGIVDRATLVGGLRAYGSIGQPLSWMIAKNSIGIFSLELTVRKTEFTVAELPLKKRTLYVNVVTENDEPETSTEKRPELGNLSILEFVKRLEKGPAEIETEPE